jgi:acyl-CoA synthetase (AMP-forming)/AMP-acid ligase II
MSVPDFDYHGKAEARAEAGRDGLVSVGDVGYLDADGYLFLCDRKRDMVISGGVNIYPAEIENALIGMDGVRDCAVFGVPDDEFGERLFACIEPEADAALSPAAVQEFLRGGSRISRCQRTSSSWTRCRAKRPARSSSASCVICMPRHAARDGVRVQSAPSTSLREQATKQSIYPRGDGWIASLRSQ